MNLPQDIALVRLDHPPVNSLGHAQRERLVQQLEAALGDERVRGIVLAGNDKAFSAGADVSEFGTPRQLQEPILRTVIARLEASAKPVVAAISGLALGGGLELALACHGRVARASARVGLPEITLGLIPGAGGTQRLPRMLGVAAALELMLDGQMRSARQLEDTALFDAVVEDEPIARAAGHALTLAARGQVLPRARDWALDPAEVAVEVQARRARLHPRQRLQPAYAALLEAVEATALPFDQGLQRERELFLGLVSSTAAQALRYQFKAEREAAKLPPSLQATPRPARNVAVIGAGTMGSGIAIAALDAGLKVLLLEQDADALARGLERIAAHHRERVAAGKLAPEAAAERAAQLDGTLDWPRLAETELVIEAVFEDLGVKQQVFRQIDAHARPGAVLATNTSYLDVDAIASVTSRPQDVLGLHFFAPAQVMKLLEVVRGSRTQADVLATGMALGVALKKTPVLAGNAFGFIGNRIYNAYRRQCEFMLEDGAWPEEVDGALTQFGFAMGPFAVADLSGLDIAWRMRRAQAATRDPRERHVAVLDRLCEAGRLGRKSGAGYYAYPNGKPQPTSDETVRGLILAASAERGLTRRTLSVQEIQRRALLAMANEAAQLLAEGITRRPGDIDVVMVQGYGFPRWEGGPVFWAARQDRRQLESELDRLAQAAGHGFVRADLQTLLEDRR